MLLGDPGQGCGQGILSELEEGWGWMVLCTLCYSLLKAIFALVMVCHDVVHTLPLFTIRGWLCNITDECIHVSVWVLWHSAQPPSPPRQAARLLVGTRCLIYTVKALLCLRNHLLVIRLRRTRALQGASQVHDSAQLGASRARRYVSDNTTHTSNNRHKTRMVTLFLMPRRRRFLGFFCLGAGGGIKPAFCITELRSISVRLS